MPPTIESRGRITFSSTIILTSDPSTYEPFTWEKRISVHKVLGGDVVIQDFGLFAKDNVVHISSGDRGPIDKFIKELLRSLYATGGSYRIQDWMGNDYMATIINFKWWPHIVDPLYFYDMTLQVTSIQKVDGSTYTGN